jgi:hypothetical protein
MPAASAYRTMIYLRGTEEEQLNDAEDRCRSYAARFGWHVLESIRDDSPADSRQLLPKISDLDAQIVLTETLDMISPDPQTRDGLMMAIERSQCIVHPITTPTRPLSRPVAVFR